MSALWSLCSGVDILLRAFARVPTVHLRLKISVRDGSDEMYLRQVRRLAEADTRVELLGPVTHAELYGFIGSLDAICIPSRVPESFSFVLHEAAAVSVPAIVTARGDPGQFVRAYGGGLVVASDDVESWAVALKHVVENPHVLKDCAERLPLPSRVEEEGFFYESLYRQFVIQETSSRSRDTASAVVPIDTGVNSAYLQPPGVNVVGHAMSEKGVGEALRSSVRSLSAAAVPHVVIDFPDPGSANTDRTPLALLDHNPHAINLIHVNADLVPLLLNTFGSGFFRGKYNIGFWVWELPNFPSVFHGSFAHLEEVWVPSAFCHEAVAQVSPVPVVKIPYSLPAGGLQTKGVGREHFGLPKDSCIFLFMFDVHSVLQRKNPSGVIRAFKQAFGAGDDVRLVLKVVHADHAMRAAIAEEAQDERVLIFDQVLERTEVNSLIELCDRYVSLHRSEGFGLTIAESMALGKPVIATGYSGNMDFMTPSNSFPVGYDLVELDQDYGPYPRGSVWADPDVENASQLMRLIYDDPRHAQQIGERAARDIWQYLSPEAVGARMARRLELVAGCLDGHHGQHW